MTNVKTNPSPLPGTLALIQTAWHTFHERIGAFLDFEFVVLPACNAYASPPCYAKRCWRA